MEEGVEGSKCGVAVSNIVSGCDDLRRALCGVVNTSWRVFELLSRVLLVYARSNRLFIVTPTPPRAGYHFTEFRPVNLSGPWQRC